MRAALRTLDAGLPSNPLVRIGQKRKQDGWITLTPFDPQPDPANLDRAQGRVHCDMADDQSARHGQGDATCG